VRELCGGEPRADADHSAAHVLPRIAEVVRDRVPLLLDGGVRCGSDVALALALGATAVGIGRPVVWGLAAGGECGVRHVLELDHALALRDIGEASWP
jgi:4-hydroxymandelate oxidase